MSYNPIQNYGIIGNLNTIALVGMDGSIDFMCFPYFDSPSVFASLLDNEKGGRFKICPGLENANLKQMYLPDTNVLLTRFLSDEGVGEITDFMPVEEIFGGNVLVRRVIAVRGEIKFNLICQPRFNYGRSNHKTENKDKEVTFFSEDDLKIKLTSNINLEIKDGDIITDFTLKAGESAEFILQQLDGKYEINNLSEFVERQLFETMNYWKKWINKSKYNGFWRDEINRSALVLKLFTSYKHGSIIASPTFGLPEQIGGLRNWDYRYCWIRDASFTVFALIQLGYKKEAQAYNNWIEKKCEDIGKAGSLNLMYTIDGLHVPDEEVLDHFEGYKKSIPVRIGNKAKHQKQLDIYGELIDSVYIYNKYAEPVTYDFFVDLVNQVEWLEEHWQDEDEGIWEFRGGRKVFLYSHLMSWVAFDRIIKIAEARSFPYPGKWKDIRNKIFYTIHTDFWDKELNAFVQYKGAKSVDASTLLMPLMRFISPKDKKWISTLKLIEKDLVSDSLVYRYKHEKNDLDPWKKGEGTFSMCTFWYIECLAKMGELEKARFYFEKMLGYSNHLGLYSEELSFSGDHLGNFPQAFTHLGLISAAITLDRKINKKEN